MRLTPDERSYLMLGAMMVLGALISLVPAPFGFLALFKANSFASSH
jgi:hypothetical protein